MAVNVAAVRRVLVVIAMEGEAMPAVTSLKLEKTGDILPAAAPGVCFSGTCRGVAPSGEGEGKEGEEAQVAVVMAAKDAVEGVDSVGTVPAALNTFLAIQSFKPDLIINAGTCGGFKARGGDIGDVYVATKFVNHDRRIPGLGPAFENYGLGIREGPAVDKLIAELGYKPGVVSTGNSLDCLDSEMALFEKHGATCKEMEAAGMAYAAGLTGTPMIGVKVITDIVDGEHATPEEFLKNFAAAGKSLQEAVPRVLRYVIGRPAND
eukprot:g5069.t1